jgi:type IV pilus assembly protein PilC
VPLFRFAARDSSGRQVRGVESALDLRALDRALESRQLVLVSARPGAPRNRVREKSARVRIDFCHHLATAVDAGLPLATALRDLGADGESPIADVLEDLTRKLESGQMLSQAMVGHPALFPPLVRALVATGEQTGELPRILRRLVATLEWNEALRQKLRAALLYPAIVLAGIVGLVALLTAVVLPNFLQLFADFDVELPLVTRAMIATHAFVSASWPLLAAGVLSAGLGLFLAARTPAGLLRMHEALLGAPVVGAVVNMVEMSRFARNLGLLYAAGIPVVRALEMVAEIVQNRVVRESVSHAAAAVRSGETLTEALGRSRRLPPLVMRMIALGERSGGLDQALEHAASHYDRELPERIDRALALFNAALIVGLGVLLTAIALGLFVPLYQMMGNLDEVP